MNWNYKIDLVDEDVFAEIEQDRKVTLPEELKKLIIEANAATPEKYRFMVGTSEKVLGAILSFNKDEKEADTVYTALNVIENVTIFPFAIDSFGNYICIDLETNEVVFWDHETDRITNTGRSLINLIDSLY